MSVLRGHEERREALGVALVHVEHAVVHAQFVHAVAVRDEHRHDVAVSEEGGDEERRAPVGLAGVDEEHVVGQQVRHALGGALAARHEEARGAVCLALLVDLDVAGLEQVLEYLVVAAVARLDQRRLVVARRQVRLGVVLQQLLDHLHVALLDGVEERRGAVLGGAVSMPWRSSSSQMRP